MKQQKLILGTLIILFYCNNSKAQNWLTAGNTLTGVEFFGSNAGAFPLRIGTTPTQPINFSTAGVSRMTIRGQVGPTQGFIGIGQAFTTPTSLLHLNAFGSGTGNVFRTDAIQTTRNQWQLFNGAAAASTTEKGVLFTDNAALVATQGDLLTIS